MKPFLAVLLLACLTLPARAEPLPAGGAEALWLVPPEVFLQDIASGQSELVSLKRPRRLSHAAWLTVRLEPGQVAWVRLAGDARGEQVEFARLGNSNGAQVVQDALLEQRGPGEFLFAAPVGPRTTLALRARNDQKAPRAQIWLAGVNHPDYRWERWEELGKRWAKKPAGVPPAVPDESGRASLDEVAVVADVLARAEQGASHNASEEQRALLLAELLLATMPAREPLFPFFGRVDHTSELAQHEGLAHEKVEGTEVLTQRDGQTLRFHMAGPSIVRIDARALLAEGEPSRRDFTLVLRSEGRVLGLLRGPVYARPKEEAEDPTTSWLRRVVAAAPPGDHTYELEVRGAAAHVSIIEHKRHVHLEDAITGAENIEKLLARATQGKVSGLLGELLSAEAAFVALDSARAKDAFAALSRRAQDPMLRAFALARMSALASTSEEAYARGSAALDALEASTGDAARRLRELIGVAVAMRALSANKLHLASDMVTRVPTLSVHPLLQAGAFVAGAPEQESEALAQLGAALRQHPLDEALQHAAGSAFHAGMRWTEAPLELDDHTPPSYAVAPSQTAHTCRQASDLGVSALVPVPAEGITLRVNDESARPPFLRRTHLVTTRAAGTNDLGRVDIELDGQQVSLPSLPVPEHIAIALGSGNHSLRARSDRGEVLVPCTLVADALFDQAFPQLFVEQRWQPLGGKGSVARAVIPDSDTAKYANIAFSLPAGQQSARLQLKTDSKDLGLLEVHADSKIAPPDTLKSSPVVFELPRGTHWLELTRADDSPAPLPLRLLIRRGAIPSEPRPSEARAPSHTLSERDTNALRAATQRLRAAHDQVARAEARLERAALLVQLGMAVPARADLMRALPGLDADGQRRAQELLAALSGPALLEARAESLVLASGTGLGNDASAQTCVNAALRGLPASDPALRARLAGCDSALGSYLAARLADLAAAPADAGKSYARAYELSGSAALAREAALRLAGAGDDPQIAFALAHEAEQGGDPDAERAVQRANDALDFRALPTLEGENAVPLPAPPRRERPEQDALLDLPWPRADVTPLRAGNSLVTSFRIEAPLSLRPEVFCERNGATADEAERCPVDVEIDGVRSHADLRSGEVTKLAEMPLARGEHHAYVVLAREAQDAQVFVRLTTSRRVGDAGDSVPTGDGRFMLTRAATSIARFTARAGNPLVVPVTGPITLRVDGLYSNDAGGKQTLEATISYADGSVKREQYAVCDEREEQLTGRIGARFDCHATVYVAVRKPGAAKVSLAPARGGDAAFTLATSKAAPESEETQETPVVVSAPGASPPSLAESDRLARLDRPLGNAARAMGTLALQFLEVYGSKAANDPRVGDRFQELSVYYRRKLDDLPIWLMGAGFLRLHHDAPSSQGGELLTFTRIPPIQLRWLTDLRYFSQGYQGGKERSLEFESYLERTFQTFPRFYVLPRAGMNITHQTLSKLPPLRVADNSSLDPSVYSAFDRIHPFGAYGQVLLWWVPYMNVIAYGAGRVTSSSNVREVDRYTGRAGLHIIFGTSEINGTYLYAYKPSGTARKQDRTQQQIGGELDHTLWVTRGMRLGFRLAGSFDVPQHGYLILGGMFWEGSYGRGLDDYSPRDTNFPQQLSQGRGVPGPEQNLR